MTKKAWSSAEEARLMEMYSEDDDIDAISDYFDKSPRSVISKLVQLRIYQKPTKPDGDKKPSVKAMLRDLETILDIEIEGTNLTKKDNLSVVVTALKAKLNIS